jgi:preprotein translocase subunit SecA
MAQKTNMRTLKRILAQVQAHRDQMAALSNDELAGLTDRFKTRLAQGETLDALLPEAFAAVCEADKRVLGMFPFDTQIMCAIALHRGCLAEMNTGEGKTLVATMPLYLNALTGKSTILVTTNEYLALRDAKEMGRVYRFLGLSVMAGVTEKPNERLTNDQKRKIYAADIVYTTHSVLGFDYLFNNLVTSAQDRFMREFYYVVIDEADSVLLDSAQMPLVISGSPRVQSNLYEMADFFVTTLKEDDDYEKEDKKVWLTDKGVRRAERFFGIPNFYGREFFEINRHVILALRAHVLFEEGKEYVISGSKELVLLDGSTGRMMPGVKLRGGQHQALEQKEKLKVSTENRSVASVTYQNLFRMFPKMSGMSGTIADTAQELREVYGAEVVVIPPNKPVQRKDLPDQYFPDAASQFQAALECAVATHKTGQPVLIVVSTIAETQIVSKLLIAEEIGHNVLNANNAFWEADIIKEAGRKNAVTVATSMAGRGTDIKLGEGVKELGGLAVIGIGRMENIRLERQARGRSGRQGDPGFSRFFVSAEDEIVTRYAPLGKKKIRSLRRFVDNARMLGEELAQNQRRQSMEYDQILQRQRSLMYATRNALLDGGSLEIEEIASIAQETIRDFISTGKYQDPADINRFILDNISYTLDGLVPEAGKKDKEKVEKYLLRRVRYGYDDQRERIGSDERMEDFVRKATLAAIDEAWVEQVDYLQQLQAAVSGRASAQMNLLDEYQKEALESFLEMEKTIRRNIVRNVLLSSVYPDDAYGIRIVLP